MRVPIQGGTDVMVALNFDRARPTAILDLNEVAELRGWSRENGTLRLGAGLTYAEASAASSPTSCRRSPRRRARSARRRSATAARSAATSARRRPPETRCRRCSSRRRRSSLRASRRHAAHAVDRVPRRAEAERPAPGRADRGGRRPSVGRPADVHQGRPAERDGDRGLLARARSSIASAARSAPHSARPARWPGSCGYRSTTSRRVGEAVAAAASPIDDVRGTAAYRRHALARARAAGGREVPRRMRIAATRQR